MTLVPVLVINFLGAGVYGECEFVFASIKVVTIVGLIVSPVSIVSNHFISYLFIQIMGLMLDLGGGPNHDRIGFRYWKNPVPFVQFDGISGSKGRFLGFWEVLVQAGFSYLGCEIVAVRRHLCILYWCALITNCSHSFRSQLAKRKILADI
jgi:yeast amino acid transporter